VTTEKSAVEIARQQRHILLLEKVKVNKALTAPEMRELGGYEAERQKAETQIVAAKPAQGKRGKAAKIAEADVRRAGQDCETIEQAAEKLGVADLQELLDGKPKLAAAWERGRFLRRVRDLATETLIVVEEADKFLGLERGRLTELLKRDRTVDEVWRAGRFQAMTSARKGLKRLADAGDPKAIPLYEQMLDSPASAESLDWDDLTPTQLEQATGIKRNQWRRWEERNGCPRKSNRRYSLPAVIEWLRGHEKTGGVKLEHGLNLLQAEKMRRERMDNDRNAGLLMETAEHEAEILGRARHLAALLSPEHAEQWSLAFAGKTAAQLREIILPAFDKVVAEYHKIAEDINLPPGARAKLEEGFHLLERERVTTDERR